MNFILTANSMNNHKKDDATVRIGIIGIVEQEWLATITGLTEQVSVES